MTRYMTRFDAEVAQFRRLPESWCSGPKSKRQAPPAAHADPLQLREQRELLTDPAQGDRSVGEIAAPSGLTFRLWREKLVAP
jgi:hypothetical protein